MRPQKWRSSATFTPMLISENRVQAEQNLSRKEEYENIKQRVWTFISIFLT